MNLTPCLCASAMPSSEIVEYLTSFRGGRDLIRSVAASAEGSGPEIKSTSRY
jgi:hypothetical protein